jgi:hypothetical protein
MALKAFILNLTVTRVYTIQVRMLAFALVDHSLPAGLFDSS